MNIFIISKYRYRLFSLNNFIYKKKICSYKIYKFFGLFSFYIGKIILFFKLGKVISLDGSLSLKKNEGINLWMGGTNFKISKNFSFFKNNFVNMKSIFLKKENLFQMYPFAIQTPYLRDKINIIYASNITITEHSEVLKFWSVNKSKFLKNFTILDNIEFWKKFKFFNDREMCFFYYRRLKNLLRLEIVKKLNIKYKNILLIGNDWKKYALNNLPNINNPKLMSEFYNGNVCIDFGSKAGSLSLYPRSINIIESGGMLLQLRQNDFKVIWNKFHLQKNFLFSSFKELFLMINKIQENKEIIKKINKEYFAKFKKSERLMERQFSDIFYSK
jgi:hypothetical protein